MKSSRVKSFPRTVFWSSPRPRKTILLGIVGFFYVALLLLLRVGFSSSFSSSSSPFQIAIENGNFNRKLLQYSRMGAPKRNGGDSYYSYNEDEGVPLNSNPSVGSNTMSNIEDFDDYDKSAYYSYEEEESDNNNDAEEEEDLGGSGGEGEVETVMEEEEEEKSPSSSVFGGATARSGEMDVSPSLLSRSRSAAENDDDDDGYVTLRDGSRKQTTFWYKAAKKIGKNEHVRRFGQQSAKFGMRVARSKPVQSTGRGFMNSHRKAKDTLKRTKLMRDASDRQVNQAMLGIMVVLLACWMLFGMFVIVPARERRQREWAEKVES